MNNYLRRMSEAELGYIAASFDGEGFIGIIRSKREMNSYYQASVAVTNTNIDLLTWLKATTQIGRIRDQENGNDRHKTRYVWMLDRKDMVYLLPQILPYLITKSEQAESILEFVALPKGNLESKERLYFWCTALNATGAKEGRQEQFFGTRWSRYVRTLKESELGYIAAMFDTEGCLGVLRSKTKNSHQYSPRVDVTNTNTDLLLWLRDTTQVGKIEGKKNDNSAHKQRYIWRLRQLDMIHLLPQIMPYLVLKSEQSKIVLKYLSLPEKQNRKKPLTLEELQIRESLYQRTLQCNAKGPNE